MGKQGSRKLGWILTVVVLASILLPAMILGAIELRFRFDSEVREVTNADASELMRLLKQGLNPTLWAFIPENAQQLLDGIALNKSVRRISVLDSEGEPFVSYVRDNYQPEAGAIVMQEPVFRADEKDPIGEVTLEYSAEAARSKVLEDSKRLMLITAFQLLFSVACILILIRRRVTTPLMRIKAFASAIANQNFNATLETRYRDEFADLTQALDDMKLALKGSFETLEERVQQRTEELSSVNEELRQTVTRLEEAKDNLVQTEKLAALGALVAGVSHELNTPIGNARIMATSLHDAAVELQKSFADGTVTKTQFVDRVNKVAEGAELIEKNLVKAVNLVQSFKQVAVDRSSENRRNFHLNEFLYEIDAMMQHIFRTKPFDLVLALEEDTELDSYPGVLSQVVSNLIDNAVMHGLAGRQRGEVRIITCQHFDRVDIIVKDNGAGMEEEVRKHIFEPFFTTRLGKGGSGLGMHIVHNIVTGTLGGTVTVLTEPGVGTEVKLTIPKIAPEHPEGESQDQIVPPGQDEQPS